MKPTRLLSFSALLVLAAVPAVAQAPPGTVPMIVAFGHGDRTVVSLDDGKTWIANQFVEDGEPDDKRYSEHKMRSMGLAYDEGVFVKWVGWNGPVKISRSTDGADWEVVADRDKGWAWSGAGANGVFLHDSGKRPYRSTDGGRNWEKAEPGVEVGHTSLLHGEGDRWIKYGDGKLAYSTDNAITWREGTLSDPEQTHCLKGRGAFGGGHFVIVGNRGADGGPGGPYLGCFSSDGGETWRLSNEIEDRSTGVLWTGERFLLYARNGTVYESGTGEIWTKVEEDTSNVRGFGSFTRTDQGTFIAIEGDGGKPKAGTKTEVFRSEDGLNWEVVTFDAPGDQLAFVEFGYGKNPEATLEPEPAEERTWTNSEGATFEGVYVSSEDETVTILRAVDQREFQVPLSELSEGDRKYVAGRE